MSHGLASLALAWSPRAAQDIRQSVHVHDRLHSRRIHRFDARSKHQVHTLSVAGVKVGLQRSRIGGEIVGGSELRRVHENGHGDASTSRFRRVDQRYMTLVEGAHRWHEADRLAGPLEGPDRLATRVDVLMNLHTA